ncbi:Serine protease, subtilisin family [Glycomyces harbinensis]|uniref:Serine protease, subtilisin family n=2 Tax=Glycomyces harbinensis TaxID=58114 RepID=A0A1G7CSN7_9ACTN|nr:Serine protease, subtilisin family [Glycomyces harbinensis]
MLAAAGTILLPMGPAQAQGGEWNIPMAEADDRLACVPVDDKDSDSLNQQPWTKNFIGLDDAQQYNRGTFEAGSKIGDPVTIAVIDSGVAKEREDVFGSRLLEGFDHWDAASKGQCDAFYHGTAVAAIAAGGALDENFIGVAPEANILPIRIFQNDEDGGDENKSRLLADAIRAAAEQGADVINTSLVVLPTTELQEAVDAVIAEGVVIVAATGNETKFMEDPDLEFKDQGFYPANYPDVIAVGAHNETGNWYDKTNYGENIDLLAPGQNVSFPFAGGEWQSASGTSFAAPFVAGAAALLKAEFGAEATPAWIQKRLQETAIHPPNGFNVYQGYGVLNVKDALSAPIADPGEITSTDVGMAPVEDQTSGPPLTEDERDAIAPLDPDYDPLRTEKTVAWASVGGALVLIALVLVLKKVIPKGRTRRWRPGSREIDRLPVKVDSA